MTTPPDADERTQPDALRTRYIYLMAIAAKELFDHNDAIELVHVCLELGRMGYVLNENETDWQPPQEAHDGQ